jgi:hypothetical protein
MNSFEIALKALDEQDEKGIGIEGVKAMQLCNAADELLAALETIIALNEGIYPEHVEVARAAIAKAKGENHG